MSKELSAEAQAAQAAHQQLIEQLDNHSVHKSFRNPSWRPNQRRNKNIKTILVDASRKEASVIATPQDNNSGAATPVPPGAGAAGHDDGLSTSGMSTPAVSGGGSAANGSNSNSNNNSLQPNLAQASRSLSKLVLEKSLKPLGAGAGPSAPSATYTNIESAPSMAPMKRYCDITGLSAPYTDPKTRLRYHNREIFSIIRSFPQGVAEQYLEARGAQTVLK